MDPVLANRVRLASAMAGAREILREARDGAEGGGSRGSAVIDTLQELHASGDRADGVDSLPSGTMAFLSISEMGRGRRFSAAVREAMAAMRNGSRSSSTRAAAAKYCAIARATQSADVLRLTVA